MKRLLPILSVLLSILFAGSARTEEAPAPPPVPPEPVYAYSVEQWVVLLPTWEPGGTIPNDALEDRSVRVLYKVGKPVRLVIKGNAGTGSIKLNEMEPKPRPDYFSPIGFDSELTFRFKDGFVPDKESGKVAFVVGGLAHYNRISDGLMKNAALEKYGFDGGLYEGKEGEWLIHAPHYADEAAATAMGKHPRLALRFKRLAEDEDVP